MLSAKGVHVNILTATYKYIIERFKLPLLYKHCRQKMMSEQMVKVKKSNKKISPSLWIKNQRMPVKDNL